MYNIAFAKVGKSIKFLKSNYSPIGGDNEPSCVLRALANHNPDKTFYLIGRSDFGKLNETQRLDLFPYENVVDVWAELKIPNREALETQGKLYYEYPVRYFKEKNINIDYGVIMVGQIGTVTIPGKTEQVKDRSLIASVIDMTKWYSTPVITWINETNIPFVEVISDPRYKLNQARDIIRPPTLSLSQYDFVYEKKHFTSFDNQDLITTEVPVKYAGVEKSFCVDYEKPSVNTNRTNPFMVILNEGKPSRYNFLKKWVLDHIDDVEIYGQWSDKVVNNDSRFRGSIHIDEVQRKLKNVRSTFIIPIAKGWTTSKYIEMVHAGVIPFFHPTYDEQNHTDMPDYFRPQTPKELQKRVAQMANDDEAYCKSIQFLIDKYLTDDLYSGEYINDQIMSHIVEDYVKPDLSNYTKKVTTSLDAFFV